MLKNYIIVALRNLVRYKGFAAINIVGMAVGIAATIIIAAFVLSEFSYENSHTQRDQIYRIGIDFGKEGSKKFMAGAMPALGPALRDGTTEVTEAVRILRGQQSSIVCAGQEFTEPEIFFVDSTVFNMFSFQLIRGEAGTALVRPFSAVISESLAQKYFGSDDPLGRILVYSEEHPLTVTGVIRDIPSNTVLRTNFMISYSSLEPMGVASDRPWNQWGSDHTYVLIPARVDPEVLQPSMSKLLQENAGEWFASQVAFRLQRFSDIYLTSEARGEWVPVGNRSLVILLGIVAAIILLLACVNYVNLATARTARRLKSLETQRILGATRSHLTAQLLVESTGYAALAALIGLALFELAGPTLYNYLGSGLVESDSLRPTLYLFAALVTVIVGLVAGGYPAVVMAGRTGKPRIKSSVSSTASGKKSRQVLVVLQFSLTIVLILAAVAVLRQVDFMRNTDLGFDKEGVVLLPWSYMAEPSKYVALKNRLEQEPTVSAVSGAYTLPGVESWSRMNVRSASLPGDSSVTIRATAVDQGYCGVLGLECVRGKKLADLTPGEAANGVMLNEAAVALFELADPIGATLTIPFGEDSKDVSVVGVVRDFHLGSFERAIQPLLMYVDQSSFVGVAVRINGGDLIAAGPVLQQAWSELYPESTLRWRVIADMYDRLYGADERMGQLVWVFSALALAISCMGLLGLVALTTETRTREMGVRKVMGASAVDVVKLFSTEFVLLVTVSNLIAGPLAYYLISHWLDEFAYRIDPGWTMFVLTGLSTLAVALLTVSVQVVRAACSNPIQSLRYE